VPAPAAGRRPTLLVFGGSQGAHAINLAVTGAVPEVLRQVPELHVIHQTGERDYNDVRAAYEKAGIAADVSAFIDDMPRAFAQADLLVCRSGASTVAEAAAAGKPAVYIPLPTAADDHQRRNAEAILEGGAAVLIPQAELTPAKLAQTVAELMGNHTKLEQMSARAKKLSHNDAAGRVARMVGELAGKG